jgi:RHS repeat-associated protein
VLASASLDGSSRLTEIEAYQSVPDAANDRVQWLITDHLGTPRLLADLSGSLAGMTRHDYLPFGEEAGAGVGGRTNSQGYGQVDNVRQQFAGSERDGETGLDYMKARYCSSTMGRFTSVDPLMMKRERLYDPQLIGLYVYARNNPLALIDPDGRDPKFVANRNDRTYGVTGKSLNDALKNAIERAKIENPITKQPGQTQLVNGGFKVDMETTFDLAPEDAFKLDQATGEWTFTTRVTNVTVTADIEVSTPNWENSNQAPDSDKKQWDTKLGNLKDHEEMHACSIEQAGVEFANSIDGMTITGTGKTKEEALKNGAANGSQAISKLHDEAIKKINQVSSSLDRDGLNRF